MDAINVVALRKGGLFFHHDSRLKTAERRPRIVKSLDVTGAFRRYPGGLVRFDYGHDADGRLLVEIALYRPTAFIHWSYRCFDTTDRGSVEQSLELREIARTLRTRPMYLAQMIFLFANPIPLVVPN